MKIAIYLLVDPREPGKVRYVGQTKVPRIRHLQHCAELGTSPKGQWIETLRQDGVFPQMTVVEWVDENQADDAEKRWIARFPQDLLTNAAVRSIPRSDKPDSPNFKTMLTELEAAEKDAIEQTLKSVAGNKLRAPQTLGIGRQTLYNKIKLYGL